MTGFESPNRDNNEKDANAIKTNTTGKNLLKAAIYHHTQGDLANAEKKYREAIKIGNRSSSTFTNLGVICKNSGRLEEALILSAIE